MGVNVHNDAIKSLECDNHLVFCINVLVKNLYEKYKITHMDIIERVSRFNYLTLDKMKPSELRNILKVTF